MPPCTKGPMYPASVSLLSCTNTTQLADFCSFIVPNIWAGSLKSPILPKRQGAFKFFCQKIIKATQISCACIVLALYYVYRLRSAYPCVQGSIGSEVRLFTTALVLANKYLDDNTFTNKTWSDVSNIPVHELNIMEVEFLAALNYRIHVHHLQFFSWAEQCQQWMSLSQLARPVKMPTRLTHLKPVIAPRCPSLSHHLPLSLSLPILPSSLKRAAHQATMAADTCYYPEQPAKRLHLQYTPPSETNSRPHTPLYTPPAAHVHSHSQLHSQLHSHSIYSISSCSNVNALSAPCDPLWKPILSWSSSSSALASRHISTSTTSLPSLSFPNDSSVASTIAPTAAAVAMSTSHSAMLCARVQCLEIE